MSGHGSAGNTGIRRRALPALFVAIYGAAAAVLLCAAALVRDGRFRLPAVLDHGLSFRFDGLSAPFVAAASAAWFLAGLFSFPYFSGHGEDSREHGSLLRFHAPYFLSFLFTVGVFVSGDFLTLFVFFELLTLSSYLLVRYESSAEAERAGILYLYMSIAGGLLVLGGILIVSWHAGDFRFSTLASLPERERLVALGLLIAGFGVKAGLPGLNVWLPEAHPVAPSPASAVLSGVMIKVGVYGIVLALNSAGEFALRQQISLAIALMGVLDIWWGGLRALGEDNFKRILAFSSVSQMGYILVAVGTWAASSPVASAGHLPPLHAPATPEAAEGAATAALALSGALYHVLAHSAFKACLFLVAGAFLIDKGTLSLRDLRGQALSSPWLAAGTLAGALSLAGFPGTAGFVSKTLVHEALLEAAHESPHGLVGAALLERAFLWGSYLTAVYVGKVLLFVFSPAKGSEDSRKRSGLRGSVVPIVFSAYAALLVFAGALPAWVAGSIIEPALHDLGLPPAHMPSLLSPAALSPVLTGYVWAAVIVAGLRRGWSGTTKTSRGGTLLLVYERFLPAVGSEMVKCGFACNDFAAAAYARAASGCRWFGRFSAGVEAASQNAWYGLSRLARIAVSIGGAVDRAANRAFEDAGHRALDVVTGTVRFDAAGDLILTSVARESGGFFVRWTASKEAGLQESVSRASSRAIRLPAALRKVDDALNLEAESAAKGAGRLVRQSSRLVEASRPRSVEEWSKRTSPGLLERASVALIWLTVGIVALTTLALIFLR